jgi:hypothetical protein
MRTNMEPRNSRKGPKTEEMNLLDLLSQAALPKCRKRIADFSFAGLKGVSRLSRLIFLAASR